MIEALRRLGWTDDWDRARGGADPGGAWQPVRIVAEHRGAYHALGPARGAAGGPPELSLGWVELSGKTFHAAEDKRALPTVGDWVLVERWDAAVGSTGSAVVRVVLPRRSFLVRKAAGQATVPQPLAANVDVGLVLTSANADLSPPRLDRYVTLLRDGGITPVLVLSKVDLAADRAPLIASLEGIAEVRVIAASSTTGEGLREIAELARPATTTVLLGSSGVGKSTLLNALAGTQQDTRGIRADERGRHTTTRRELFVAPDDSLWIDTPGMRELAHWVDSARDDSAIDEAFDDITALAASCRFRDCRHQDEPGCAVRGAVAAERVTSFAKLAHERTAAAARQARAKQIGKARKPRPKLAKPED